MKHFLAGTLSLLLTPSAAGAEFERSAVADLVRQRAAASQTSTFSEALQEKGVDLSPVLKVDEDGFELGNEDWGPHLHVNEDGVGVGVNNPIPGFPDAKMKIDGGGFSGGASAFGNGFDASVGPNGINARGKVNVFGVVGADGKVGCTADGCYGEGYAWYNEDCANWWLDNLKEFPGSIPAFKMPQIQVEDETYEALLSAATIVNDNFLTLLNPGNTCYQKLVGENVHRTADNVIEYCIGTEEATDLIAPVCKAIHSSPIVEAASATVAEVRSFAGSCLEDVLPGLSDFANAFALGVSVTLTAGGRATALEVGVTYRFSEDGSRIEEKGCFIAGFQGYGTDVLALEVGVSAALWKSYDSIAGPSMSAAVGTDLCDLFGLPCELDLGVGVITTYSDKSEREALKNELLSCATLAAGTSGLVLSLDAEGLPMRTASKCFSSIEDFFSKVSAIFLEISAGPSVPLGLPLYGEVTQEFTVVVSATGASGDPALEEAGEMPMALSMARQIPVEFGELPCEAIEEVTKVLTANFTQLLDAKFACSEHTDCAFDGFCKTDGSCQYPARYGGRPLQDFRDHAEQMLLFDTEVDSIVDACKNRAYTPTTLNGYTEHPNGVYVVSKSNRTCGVTQHVVAKKNPVGYGYHHVCEDCPNGQVGAPALHVDEEIIEAANGTFDVRERSTGLQLLDGEPTECKPSSCASWGVWHQLMFNPDDPTPPKIPYGLENAAFQWLALPVATGYQFTGPTSAQAHDWTATLHLPVATGGEVSGGEVFTLKASCGCGGVQLVSSAIAKQYESGTYFCIGPSVDDLCGPGFAQTEEMWEVTLYAAGEQGVWHELKITDRTLLESSVLSFTEQSGLAIEEIPSVGGQQPWLCPTQRSQGWRAIKGEYAVFSFTDKAPTLSNTANAEHGGDAAHTGENQDIIPHVENDGLRATSNGNLRRGVVGIASLLERAANKRSEKSTLRNNLDEGYLYHSHNPHNHNPHSHDPHSHDPHQHQPVQPTTPRPTPMPTIWDGCLDNLPAISNNHDTCLICRTPACGSRFSCCM